jgi:hypothetical protein
MHDTMNAGQWHLRLRGRWTHQSYVWRERLLAVPSGRARALSILFSRRDAWETGLRRGFAGLPHRLHFDDLTVADLERHDLIVPLSLDDARFLRQQPAHLRERVVPLPDAECTELCHDKPRLNRFLTDAGFALHIPPMGHDLAPPFVCKPERGENSDECLLVPDTQTEQRLAPYLRTPGLFRQAAVRGHVEYATHFLMLDGGLARELTVAYHHDAPLYIKNAALPIPCTLGASPDAGTLQAMLRAVGYHGLGCANYKFEQGRLHLLEINPRMGGSLAEYFFSFLRSMPQVQRSRAAGCTNWTWLDSAVERESLGSA